MGNENFIFESFIDFMKFIKLSKGTFWKFPWNIEMVLFVKNNYWRSDRNSWNHLSYSL